MSSYQPLAQYLKENGSNRVPMSFKDVESVIGRKLPPSAYRHRPWWANEARGHSHAKAWLDAGYETEQVDMASQKLVFRRLAAVRSRLGMAEAPRELPRKRTSWRHPRSARSKGTFTIEPGHGLTSPMFADEEWVEIEKQMDEDWDQIEQGMTHNKK